MMSQLLVLAALVATVTAFSPSSARRSTNSLKMSAEMLPGALPPVGFFDPLGLSQGKSDAEMKKIREAELKHGRLAMLASLGFLVAESFNPLFDGKITGPALGHFQQADDMVPYFWVAVLGSVGMVEGQNILLGWEQEQDASGVANLKDEYVNGDLNFDPLGLKPADEESFNVMRTKELQNGRLAMLGIAGMIAQELVTGQKLF